jgi:hypothetical protein
MLGDSEKRDGIVSGLTKIFCAPDGPSKSLFYFARIFSYSSAVGDLAAATATCLKPLILLGLFRALLLLPKQVRYSMESC